MPEARSERILLNGSYGWGNLGDESILHAIAQMIQDERPHTEVWALSERPAVTTAMHGVRSVQRSDRKRIESLIQSADLVCSGGGGVLFDYSYFPFSVGDFLHSGLESIPYHLAPLFLAQLYGIRNGLWSVGVGPLNRQPVNRLLARVLSHCDFLTVRDQESANLLEQIGVTREIAVTGDPAITIQPADPAEVDPIWERYGIERSGRFTIGVCVRPWFDRQLERQMSEALRQALNKLVATMNGQLLFLPLQRDYGEPDLRQSQLLQASLAYPEESHLLNERLSPRQAVTLLSRCDLVISVRLHGAILSAAAGVPAVGLAYDPKVSRFFNEMGMAELVIPPTAHIQDNLWRALDYLLSHYSQIKSQWQSGAHCLKEKALIARDLAFEGREALR